VLVAIDLLGVDVDAQVDEEGLVLLVDRLVALGVGSLDRLEYLRVLHDAVVDIQQQSFALDRVQFGDHGLYLDLLEHFFGQVGEFIVGQLGDELESFHFAFRNLHVPEIRGDFRPFFGNE